MINEGGFDMIKASVLGSSKDKIEGDSGTNHYRNSLHSFSLFYSLHSF